MDGRRVLEDSGCEIGIIADLIGKGRSVGDPRHDYCG